MIRVKEAHQPVTRRDGIRVLVERDWPRSLAKSKAAITLWLRALAPSAGLRRWAQGHDVRATGKHLKMPVASPSYGSRASAALRQNSRHAMTAAVSPGAARARIQLFRKKYFQELTCPPASAALQQLHRLAGSARDLTLVYSAPVARRAPYAESSANQYSAAKNSHPAKSSAAKSAAGKSTEFANHAAVLKQLLEGLPKPPLSSGPEKVGSARKSRAAAAR